MFDHEAEAAWEGDAGTCENSPEVELEATGNVVVVPREDKPEAEDVVYGSVRGGGQMENSGCRGAAEAGNDSRR